MKPTNGTSYKSKDRPRFKIWDNEKNEWYKPTFEGYNGKIDELSLSLKGDLLRRKIDHAEHESVFPDRFEVVMEMPKVVVPKFVAEWIKSYFDIGGTLTDMLDSLTMPYAPVGDVELLRWFKKNTELMLKALVDGYEVEKEQLYQVQVNDMFFANWGEANVYPTFIINDLIGARKQAMSWRDKEAAENVAKIVGGKVVKVDEE